LTESFGSLSLQFIQFKTFSALIGVNDDSRFPLAIVVVEPKTNIAATAAITNFLILNSSPQFDF
jgi:hypothetical protein